MAAQPTDSSPTTTPVAVISKNAKQETRSAHYTWLVTLGLAIPSILILVGNITPQLQVIFSRHAQIVGALGGIAASIGTALLASQRQGSAKDEATVNYSEHP